MTRAILSTRPDCKYSFSALLFYVKAALLHAAVVCWLAPALGYGQTTDLLGSLIDHVTHSPVDALTSAPIVVVAFVKSNVESGPAMKFPVPTQLTAVDWVRRSVPACAEILTKWREVLPETKWGRGRGACSSLRGGARSIADSEKPSSADAHNSCICARRPAEFGLVVQVITAKTVQRRARRCGEHTMQQHDRRSRFSIVFPLAAAGKSLCRQS
jgi:hypothetical protein